MSARVLVAVVQGPGGGGSSGPSLPLPASRPSRPFSMPPASCKARRSSLSAWRGAAREGGLRRLTPRGAIVPKEPSPAAPLPRPPLRVKGKGFTGHLPTMGGGRLLCSKPVSCRISFSSWGDGLFTNSSLLLRSQPSPNANSVTLARDSSPL